MDTKMIGGADEIENTDRQDNLQDTDTLADIDVPDSDEDSLDGQTDGDRQLTTNSDAIDGGLNDSDLGAAAAGLGPDVAPPAGGGAATGGATGLGAGLRE